MDSQRNENGDERTYKYYSSGADGVLKPQMIMLQLILRTLMSTIKRSNQSQE